MAQDKYAASPLQLSPSSDTPSVSTRSDGDSDDGLMDGELDLETVLSNIGFGRHQVMMFFLCGIGWLADNMWLEAVAVILPRVQQTFLVSNAHIGVMSSCFFGGMMLGAPTWGMISDRHGRRLPFLLGPLFSAIAAGIAAASPSFPFLCAFLCLLGINAAGSIPVDGALLTEYLPSSHRYFLTLLALYFALGDATASGLAWALLPKTSCNPALMGTTPDGVPYGDCPPSENNGWRIYLGILAGIQIIFFVLRYLCYREKETPGYLLGHGRRAEAIEVLKRVARRNGHSEEAIHRLGIDRVGLTASVEAKPADTAVPSTKASSKYPTPKIVDQEGSTRSVQSQVVEGRFRTLALLFHGRTAALSTILVWAKWFFMSFGYVLYTSFLPKLLEQRGAEEDGAANLSSGYRDLFIYSLSALPGSFIARWAVNTRLGRKGTMAIFMWLTAAMLFVFTAVKSHVGAVVSISLVNMVGGVVWASFGTYAPEVFSIEVRGTGTGIASALQRVAGICAPILTGSLITINRNLPLWVASGMISISGITALCLPVETRPRRRALTH